MPFDGARVLSLESRRASEMATLIQKQGGVPFVAPSMREVPLERNQEALDFGRRLLVGEFDCVIFLTGVGLRMLWKVLLTVSNEADLRSALSRTRTVVRGSKPAAALREIHIEPEVIVPEPNTWREILAAMENRSAARVAVQEYGQSNPRLLDGLRAQGHNVASVPVYAWDLPEDTALLHEAAIRLSRREFDVVFLTAGTQLINLMKLAEAKEIADAVLHGLRAAKIGSIGPTTSETIVEYGLQPSFEPSHPKMGFLVTEMAAQYAR